MANNLRKLGILVGVVAVLFLGMLLLALSYTNVGITDKIGAGTAPLSVPDLSVVPESVAEDAAALATEIFGDYGEKYEDFVGQLLTMYVAAQGKDFVVVFKSGGWGWNFLDNSPGWRTIFSGIESELDRLGYTSLMLDYRRTDEAIRGLIDEFVEVITTYPSKAEILASRVEFLTSHAPHIKVIITGESNGTIISDSTMKILQDNHQVYSIQTGPPFWHQNVIHDRTLVLNNNGITRDSFSDGDVGTVLWASFKAMVGLAPEEEEAPGRVLYFFRAPGHDYQWKHPDVSNQITKFLEINFGNQRG